MGFEWDDEKNRVNIEKHGVSFETAAGFSKARFSPRWTTDMTMER